jgi:catechol 2,3-dioxygenase-like lactoylglutathione lyase family enzyme
MAVQGLFYILILASDLDRSKRFYRDALGWRLDTDVAGQVAGLWFGEAYLVVSQDHRPADERRYAGGSEFSVKVDDLDAQHARLTEAGVAPSAIASQSWGERNFKFHDPDGYPWCYGQPAG